jgi:hypothetical protein
MTDRRTAPRTNSMPAPTGPSFSTAPRWRFAQPNLSHVRKTLESGVPVTPCAQHLSTLPGSGFCVARKPRLSRVPVPRADRAKRFRATWTKLFCIAKVVKTKANGSRKYLLIHKEAIRKSRKTTPAEAPACGTRSPRSCFPHWTIVRCAGILIAPWSHL